MRKHFIKKAQPLYSFIILILFFSLGFAAHRYGVCINVTPCMKEGLYIKEAGKIHRGDIVAFCLGEPCKTIGLKRFYIEKGTVCQGAYPLIKEVIAVPGDIVQLTDKAIVVNTVVYPYQTFYADSHDRKLTVYPRGIYHAHGYWLIGTHSQCSWDSRYWGEINESQILSKLKPLLIW